MAKRSTLETNSKLDLYVTLKDSFGAEDYLNTPDYKIRKAITKLRISAHKFPIEVGRYTNTPKQERICPLCNDGVGSEEHYLLNCANHKICQERNPVLNNIMSMNPNFNDMETKDKCKYILAYKDPDHVKISGLLCYKIQKVFKEEMLLEQQPNGN